MKNSIVITGASGSMGSEAVRAMAEKGWPVIMACRNLEKGEAVRQTILRELPQAELRLQKLDIGSFESVRQFAGSLGEMRLAGLFNCAGVISRSFGISPDGYENTMAVNCVGPMLLTGLLLPQIEDGGHIVNMVSLTSKLAHIDENLFFPCGETHFKRLKVYSRSKLALVLYTLELAEKCPGLHVNMADPGIVDSNMISMGKWFDPLADLLFRPFCKSPASGVAPAVRALEAEVTGKYFVGGRIADLPPRIAQHPLRDLVWEESRILSPGA